MALTPKQLRLVFAKLRAKGLLRYIKKGGISRTESRGLSKIGQIAAARRDYVANRESINKLYNRIPRRHQEMTILQEIKLHDFRQDLAKADPRATEHTVGFFNHETGELHITRDHTAYLGEVGYTSRPLHMPRLRYARSRISQPTPEGRLEYPMVPTPQSSLRAGKIGFAKTFYHEFAHSLNVQHRFSKPREWQQIASREWLTDPDLTFPQSLVLRDESWSEAYAMYISGKISQTRLKRERPLSYAYMKKFFAGDSPIPSIYGEIMP